MQCWAAAQNICSSPHPAYFLCHRSPASCGLATSPCLELVFFSISMLAPDPTSRPSGPFLPFWPRESTPDPRNRILDSTPVGRKVQHAESTVPVHPQPRPFTPQLFLDFRAIFFPAWPIIFLIITKNQVIWPSPGTLVVSVNSLKFQFQFFTLNLKNSDKTKMSGRQ